MSKSKSPAFLFYYQDFFSGVADLSNEEVGAFVRCMCMQASKGEVSEKLMKSLCVSIDVFESVKQKFTYNENANSYENERLKFEIDKRTKYSESRAKNRKKPTLNDLDVYDISGTYVPDMEIEIEKEESKLDSYTPDFVKKINVKDAEILCLSNNDWIENVERIYKVDRDKIKYALSEFSSHCITIGKEEKNSLSEFKSHFTNWVRVKKQYVQTRTDGKL